MWTKEQTWNVLLYLSGGVTVALIGVFAYVYGLSILILSLPICVFAILVKTVLSEAEAVGLDQLSQTNRHVQELTRQIAKKERANKLLEKSEEQFRNSFDYAAVGMALISSSGKVIKINRALWKILGFTNDEISGKAFAQMVFEADKELFFQNLAIVAEGKVDYRQTEIRVVNKEKRQLWAIWNVSVIKDKVNDSDQFIFQLQDISDRKEAEDQLAHGALHDSLTNMPNRVLFLDRLALAFKRAERHFNNQFAVLYIDFDRFKLINDSFGHINGDKVLLEIANRLNGCLRESDTLARLGGDEFAMLVEETSNFDEVTAIAKRLQEEISRPFVVKGRELTLTVSIGIAEWSRDYSKPEFLLRDADTALNQAKRLGRNRFEIFDRQMHEDSQALLEIENDLRRAIKNDEFLLNYQPILDLKTRNLSGFEALIRWQHPEKGLVSPLDFIPVAEETGLIVEIGEWVLVEACSQLKKWQLENNFDEDIWMSVNVASKQFAEPDFVETVEKAIARTGIKPDSLKLEVTESGMIENIDHARSVMLSLFEKGIMLSIDDFGTGYSSLSYIHQLPLSSLKIDRSFVNQMGEGKENQEIIKTIVSLAKSLSLKIIAEGIETPEQIDGLLDLSCEFGQGYYFAKPLSESDVCKLVVIENKSAILMASSIETIAA